MNPGIFYFYYYTPNHPPCNVGFLKLGQRFQSFSLELHIRNIPVSQGAVLKLGAFYAKDRQFPAAIFSEISAKTNAIYAKFDISQSLLPDSCTPADIRGFFLLLPDGNIIAAAAPDVSFEPKLLRFQTPAIPISETPDESSRESSNETSDESSDETADESSDDTPDEIAAETVGTVETAPIGDNKPAAAVVNAPVNVTAEVSTPVNTAANVRKINRRDLRTLPRKYWNIANNSFLMHGYHNYNHLLLVEKDGHYMIGVPGVYSTRESHAAGLFGFPRFTAEYNQMLQLTKDEQNDYGTFGYWLCEIR